MSENYWQALLLGLVQGVTEFLPISSSAHLVVFPWLLGWQSLGLFFDVMVHGGTLGAVLIYFRKDFQEIMSWLLMLIRGQKLPAHQVRFLQALLWGTLPALLAGGFLEATIEGEVRNPAASAVNLALFGVVLGWVDLRKEGERGLRELGPREGLLIGMAQALALMPGVSRSGITITAGLLLGLRRPEAARFSFLLGAPMIALAGADQVLRSLNGSTWQVTLNVPVIIGVMVSFGSGYLCIKYLLRYLESGSYRPFVCYRLLFAAFILWLVWQGY